MRRTSLILYAAWAAPAGVSPGHVQYIHYICWLAQPDCSLFAELAKCSMSIALYVAGMYSVHFHC